ncbi:Fc.00g096310.m01.CDS01 [Cosmosporella sp. VM-42]
MADRFASMAQANSGLPSIAKPPPPPRRSYAPTVRSPLGLQVWTPNDVEDDDESDAESHYSYKSVAGLSSVSDPDAPAPRRLTSSTPPGEDLAGWMPGSTFGSSALYQPPSSPEAARAVRPPPGFTEADRGRGCVGFEFDFKPACSAAREERRERNARFFRHLASRTNG